MKRVILIFCIMLILVSGCHKKDEKIILSVWSFTNELNEMITTYYAPSHPNIEFQFTQIPREQFSERLDAVLVSGKRTPDIFALEDSFVRKYIESGLLLDISEIYTGNRAKLLEYPVQIGSHNGIVYGLSWQATPGAMFYRRSLAVKYLGTDDPALVQNYFSDLDRFFESAKILSQESEGRCVIVPWYGELLRPFLSARSVPWVTNGKLTIDPVMEKYMQRARVLHDMGWEAHAEQESNAWYDGTRDALKDKYGEQIEVFSYFLPTWGLHFILKTFSPETAGDWAIIPGPSPYRWGGTWVASWKNTPNPEAAKNLIRFLVTDDNFLEQYARSSGDFLSEIVVVDKIKDSYSEPFLGGQNHYAVFAELAKNVDGHLNQGTDQAVEKLFNAEVRAYVIGEKSQTQALSDFRTQAEIQLGL